MHELLFIPLQYQKYFSEISKKLDKRQSDCCVSFIIDAKENKLHLIGGHVPEYLHFTIPLAKDHKLKTRRFAIDGEYFSQLIGYAGKCNAIRLKLIHKENAPDQMAITTSKDEFLCCDFAPFFRAHEEHSKKTKQYEFQKIRAPEMLRAAVVASTYCPVQFIAIDKEQKEIWVQSDNNLERYDIPDNIKIPASFVFTQEALDNLKTLCEQIGDENIEIAQHNETITFKTSNYTITHSLEGVEEFYKNKPKKFDELGYMIMDINHLKERIKHFYNKYSKIKQANQSHIFIEPTQLYFLSLVKPYDFDVPIASDAISFTEDQLYILHLRDIDPIRIKDFTTSDKVKIAILKEAGQESKYKLGFYKDITHKHPYASVSIEPDPDKMEYAKAMIKNAKDNKGDELEELEEVQPDLFGFDV